MNFIHSQFFYLAPLILAAVVLLALYAAPVILLFAVADERAHAHPGQDEPQA